MKQIDDLIWRIYFFAWVANKGKDDWQAPIQHCWRRFNTFLLSLLAEKCEMDFMLFDSTFPAPTSVLTIPYCLAWVGTAKYAAVTKAPVGKVEIWFY